jgi:N-acetylglucosamine kinase-like BadF-type ATPase
MARLASLVSRARARAGLDRAPIEVGVLCLAGADTPADVRMLERAVARLALTGRILVRNDTLAVLRSGTDLGWGVAVVCGAGVNAAGIAPDGRMARLAGLGDISGDWGGGTDVGWAALAAAVRSRDGRGPRTVLEHSVPAAFGFARPASVTRALYTGHLDRDRIRELAPSVFQSAIAGDAVARSIVDRLADEVAVMAVAMLRRLHVVRSDVDVVLGGGVMATTDATFHDRIASGIRAVAPRARIIVPAAPPVVGAALLAIDELGAGRTPSVAARLRRAFVDWGAEGNRS